MSTAKKDASSIVDTMYRQDAFSQWLGIEREEVKPGYCRLRMAIRQEMTNGFGIAHGGIAYSLADSALAFASNGHGRQALSIQTSIAHTQALKEGSQLIAETRELHLTRSTGLYDVLLTDGSGAEVAHFRGTVYRTGKDWA